MFRITGVTPQTARRHLLAATGRQLSVRINRVTDVDLTTIRVILVAMSAVLALIGLANLLATMLLGLRERMNEVGLLKAVGFRPRSW
ncbi:MAG TPA: FtsX-like permease family protein [Acidimicrobiales bacterium]